MAVLPIVQYGHPSLRTKAARIEQITDEVKALIEDMIDTMQAAEGIGLAANQVDRPIALCVVDLGLIEEGAAPKPFINPRILEEQGATTMEEGCLSIPGIREDVTRPETIRVSYQTAEGETEETRCGGMLARVLQHEIDHLNGVLFIDRLSPTRRKLLSKRLKRIAEGVMEKAELQEETPAL